MWPWGKFRRPKATNFVGLRLARQQRLLACAPHLVEIQAGNIVPEVRAPRERNRPGFLPGNKLRPAVAVYNSPVLPSEPSSRRPVQPLRARPSSPAEPVALRQPTPQPF